jgi:hypothetical protein
MQQASSAIERDMSVRSNDIKRHTRRRPGGMVGNFGAVANQFTRDITRFTHC